MSIASVDDITPVIAHQVLWFYGCGSPEERIGYPPGSFFGALFRTISRADENNRELLARVYPGQVAACTIVERWSEGKNILRNIARGGV